MSITIAHDSLPFPKSEGADNLLPTLIEVSLLTLMNVRHRPESRTKIYPTVGVLHLRQESFDDSNCILGVLERVEICLFGRLLPFAGDIVVKFLGFALTVITPFARRDDHIEGSAQADEVCILETFFVMRCDVL